MHKKHIFSIPFYIPELVSHLKNENTVDYTKVDWNKEWDIHKAVNVMGFKSWRLLEPGKFITKNDYFKI